MNDELWGLMNDYISNIRHNIKITANIYVQIGLENSLELLKLALEERGYETKDFFPEDNEDEEDNE